MARNVPPPSLRNSLEEYGRGIAGGILFSLPMLYTMELWWEGFIASPLSLLLYVLFTFLLLLGYNRYAGLHREATAAEVAIDSIEEMGLGLVIAALILFLMDRIQFHMPAREVVGKIIVEAMTVAIGVSVGTAQLGVRPEDEENSSTDDGSDDPPDLWGQTVLAFCGAMLFAANVGPTEEILMIGIEAAPWRLLALALFSMLLGALILFFSSFAGSHRYVRRESAFWMAFGIIGSYAVSLVAAGLILWFFGRFQGATLGVAVSQMVVLALPAMLGASAGRLLIQ